MIGPFFYDPRQSVLGLDSFSPSAGKPARFMALADHHYRTTPRPARHSGDPRGPVSGS